MINNDFVEVIHISESQTIPQGYSVRQITDALKHVLNVNSSMDVRVDGRLADADTIPPGNSTVEYQTLIGSKGGDWCSEAEARRLYCVTQEEWSEFVRNNPDDVIISERKGTICPDRALLRWLGEIKLRNSGKRPRLVPPLKWHGGKHFLAKGIVELMPAHTHYVEPFFGGGAVLLAKNPIGTSEVVNDIDGDLINFWRVLQSKEHFPEFFRSANGVSFSQAEWCESANQTEDGVIERARQFFVFCRQSRAGRMLEFGNVAKSRIARGMNEHVSAWLSAVDGLPEVHERLRRVVILNDDALTVIRKHDGPDTLIYCDPPYLHSTRSAKAAYRHEMTENDHEALLVLLNQIEAKVILSGYPSDLYDGLLQPPKWHRIPLDVAIHASGGTSKRRMTECLWLNYDPGRNV